MNRGYKKFLILSILFTCLSVLTHCASLPRIEDRMTEAFTENPLPRIIAHHRTLSRKETKALLGRLEREAGPTDILKRQTIIMQEISGRPLIAGNHATLLVDGPATYQAMFEAIRAAKDHINLETYIFDDDGVGRRFADLLLQKQAEGVQVNLIYDALGCLNTPAAFFQRLSGGGIQILQFNPINPSEVRVGWHLTHRDHRKILVVDGKTAFTGGVNISGVYSSGSIQGESEGKAKLAWRDTHVQIEGPAVAQLQELFLETWKKQKGPPLAAKNYFPSLKREGNDLIQVIGSTPGEQNRLTYLMYISSAMFATKFIHLTNPYFVPDEQMVDALREASQRGVDVKLILPSISDESLVFYAGRSYYSKLLEAGIKIFERRGGVLHAKTATVDGVWSTIGSTNMDLWSFLRNNEVNAIILGVDFADQMENLFMKDLENSDEIHLAQWEKRPLPERLREWFSRLMSYWL